MCIDEMKRLATPTWYHSAPYVMTGLYQLSRHWDETGNVDHSALGHAAAIMLSNRINRSHYARENEGGVKADRTYQLPASWSQGSPRSAALSATGVVVRKSASS